jgi:peptidyl-dipeptidase Dcp
MWMTDPRVLANYARHYQSGAPMPKQLMDKVLAARKFNQGYATTEYLSAAILDQAWHQLPAGKRRHRPTWRSSRAMRSRPRASTSRRAAALSLDVFLARVREPDRLFRGLLRLHLERSARAGYRALVRHPRRSEARERRSAAAESAVARLQRRCADDVPDFYGKGPEIGPLLEAAA